MRGFFVLYISQLHQLFILHVVLSLLFSSCFSLFFMILPYSRLLNSPFLFSSCFRCSYVCPAAIGISGANTSELSIHKGLSVIMHVSSLHIIWLQQTTHVYDKTILSNLTLSFCLLIITNVSFFYPYIRINSKYACQLAHAHIFKMQRKFIGLS